MLKEERQQRLVDQLNTSEFLTVEQLSVLLETSEPTIRRDLVDLAAQEKLIRCRGGAMRIPDGQFISPIDFRRSVNAKAKASISKAAVSLIQPNTVVFIDASTTSAYITEHLKGRHDLIIITNSLMLAARSNDLNLRTFCLGGELAGGSMAVGDSYAIEGVKAFNVDIMFFSTVGIVDNGMIVDTSEHVQDLRKYLLKHANQSVFLCDKTKFGKKAPYNLAPLSDIDYMVTDGVPPENYPRPKKGVILAK